MKKVLIVICLLFVLVGCSNQQVVQNSTIEKQQTKENQADEDIFKKKQECAKLIEKEKESIAKYNDENKPYNNLSLLEIFYSKKMDTCLEGFVRITRTELVKPAIFTTFILKDLLENKELKGFELKSEYDEEIKMLKE